MTQEYDFTCFGDYNMIQYIVLTQSGFLVESPVLFRPPQFPETCRNPDLYLEMRQLPRFRVRGKYADWHSGDSRRPHEWITFVSAVRADLGSIVQELGAGATITAVYEQFRELERESRPYHVDDLINADQEIAVLS